MTANQCSQIKQVSLMDLILHIAVCNVGGTHDCGDPTCVAPQLFRSYQQKHIRSRERDASDPIQYGTRIIIQSPSRCSLYEQFCKRTCPRSHEYKEMKDKWGNANES